ncbi:MAG TPA: selenide, water dikinase SelD, partial [Flavisolibacter sp.]|nr:selenide, water dikinase SelD [Flavisolibacter sp.]
MENMTGAVEVRLTQFSKGGGCGCKIAPSVLKQILQTSGRHNFPDLLVGNESSDDAAVYKINEHTAIISTTDFFMPIVDDAYDFGRIASANAISDVYAMGGTPLMAIAILGWPADKIPTHVAQQVLEGSRAICKEAGIPLAGGHTIDSLEPIFGLAVTGTIETAHLKQNNTARQHDLILLTKPIGVGLLSTAVKRGVMQDEHYKLLIKQMTTLNSIGELLGKVNGVHAMTDVTGFGLLGHLMEMADGSNLSAEINYADVKKMAGTDLYLKHKTIPGATARNWKSYGDKLIISEDINKEEAGNLLPDPQTNGGLLIAIDKDALEEVVQIFKRHNLEDYTKPIGKFIAKEEKTVIV